jgi:hypothetical protein
VPKYLKLEMLPPSSTVVSPGSNAQVTQEVKVTNSLQGEKNIMLKLKISYKQGGTPVSPASHLLLRSLSLRLCYALGRGDGTGVVIPTALLTDQKVE